MLRFYRIARFSFFFARLVRSSTLRPYPSINFVGHRFQAAARTEYRPRGMTSNVVRNAADVYVFRHRKPPVFAKL
jgi:hypothetical protein